jgi:hypothetical protein
MKSATSNDNLRVSRVVWVLVAGITETERKANNSPLHEKKMQTFGTSALPFWQRD